MCALSSRTRSTRKSEQIINVKDDNGVGALLTLYPLLVNRLEYTLDVDGGNKRP